MNAWDFTSYFPGLNITAVAETKKSWILFSPEQVIKILKPIHVEGEEKSNVQLRAKALKDECDLMKIFAPSVPDKVIQLKNQESVVESALLMRRLPREYNLLARLLTNKVNTIELRRIGSAIAKIQKKLPVVKDPGESTTISELIRQLDEVTEPLLEPGAGIFLAHDIVVKIKDKLHGLIAHKDRFINSRLKSKKIKQLHGNLHASSIFSEPDKVSLMDAFTKDGLTAGDIFVDIGCLYKDIVLFVDSNSAKAFIRSCLGKTPKGNEEDLLKFYEILWTLRAFNDHTEKLYSGAGNQVDTELVQRYRNRLVRFANPLPQISSVQMNKPTRLEPSQKPKKTSANKPAKKAPAKKAPAKKLTKKAPAKKPAKKLTKKAPAKKPAKKAPAKKPAKKAPAKKPAKKASKPKGNKTIGKIKSFLGIKKKK
jgi:aminoglycoside phosphotransferase family enzyme